MFYWQKKIILKCDLVDVKFSFDNADTEQINRIKYKKSKNMQHFLHIYCKNMEQPL